MTTPAPTESGRLNGWKEIAAHLGKGTRTAQRWEKEYGLPVHRVGREGGEIVFAFRDEIDRWSRDYARLRLNGNGGQREAEEDDRGPWPSVEPPPERRPSLDRSKRTVIGAAVLVAAVGTIGLLSPRWRAPATGERSAPGVEPRRQPTTWRLAGDSLTVLDESEAILFVHHFGFPVVGAPLSSSSPPAAVAGRVLVEDVDGDGRSEVLVSPIGAERADRKLFCFEADGRLRFVHQPTGTRVFGDDEYSDPWLAHRVFVTRGPDGAPRLWAAFTHNFLFPCVLQELDPRDGAVRQEYWSDGFIELVREVTWAGRRALLVGSANNDFRAGALAVFRPDAVTGSTPAVRAGYACRNCAPGGPESVFIFPSLCILRRSGQSGVFDAWVENGDRLRVEVSQGGATPGWQTVSYYTLGPDGTLVAAEISREFQAEHALLSKQGILDHPFGPSDVGDMLPVLRWDGAAFRPLPPVPVVR